MIQHEIKTRVRYSETDKMGFVYHGNYAPYCEMGRTELMRYIGVVYNELEHNGYMLPVLTMNFKFIKPGRYDNLLTIKTYLKEMPSVRIIFDYEVYNEQNELLCIAQTVHAFMSDTTYKPCRPPQYFVDIVKKYF